MPTASARRKPAALSETCKERCRLLKVRQHMIDRCTKPEHPSFKDYGGRGIKVCQEWIDSPQAFIDHVAPRPAGLTLERVDNANGYEPGNVRWATRAEQARNRRDNIFVEINGERVVLMDACRRVGINYDTAWRRVKRGIPPEIAIRLPLQPGRLISLPATSQELKT
jgi:hypothetical protein